MLFLLLVLFIFLLASFFYLIILFLVLADALKYHICCVDIQFIPDKSHIDAPLAASKGIDVVFVKRDPSQAIGN